MRISPVIGEERKNMATTKRKGPTQSLQPMGPQQIVVLDRGWVLVGKTEESGDKLVISDARCIRYWGTTAGLGQLADSGPTEKTKLDPMGCVIAPLRAVIAVIACKSTW